MTMNIDIIKKIIESYIGTEVDPDRLIQSIESLSSINTEQQIHVSLKEDTFINDILIDSRVFQNELSDFYFVNRSDYISDLIDSLFNDPRSTVCNLIKERVKQHISELLNLTDDILLCSVNSSFEFLSPTLHKEQFNKKCLEILDINKQFN